MSEEQDRMSGATVGAMTGVTELLKVLLEDRRGRERENKQQMKVMCEHMDSLMRLVETSHRTGGPPGAATALTPSNPEVRLSKLTSSVNIEVYLLTFERMMISYGVEKAHWVVRVASQLSGKAKQAYVAMPTAEAGQYDQVKAAILRWYDINAEMYRQRFRAATWKEEESYRERWHS